MKQNWFKYALGLTACFLLRLLPFRPPNLEPLMATGMPFAKQYGYTTGFSFGFLSIVLFDTATGKLGVWTWITAFAYGIVGAGATVYLKKRNNSALNYLSYSIIGTLLYDALTGLTIGPIFYGQAFSEAFFGQIPFTLMHLAGNGILSLTISPFIYRFIVTNQRLEWQNFFSDHPTQKAGSQ